MIPEALAGRLSSPEIHSKANSYAKTYDGKRRACLKICLSKLQENEAGCPQNVLLSRNRRKGVTVESGPWAGAPC